MKPQRILILLGLLLVSGQTLAADDTRFVSVITEYATHFDSTKPQDDQSAQIDYKVPVATWRKTPRWKPEKEPVPLDAEGAVEAAKRWIAAQPWADQFESFNSIYLICWGDPADPDPVTGRWYYSVNFQLKKIEEDKSSPQPTPTPAIRMDLRPTTVVVLFNGTVIGPTVSNLVTKGDKK